MIFCDKCNIALSIDVMKTAKHQSSITYSVMKIAPYVVINNALSTEDSNTVEVIICYLMKNSNMLKKQ